MTPASHRHNWSPQVAMAMKGYCIAAVGICMAWISKAVGFSSANLWISKHPPTSQVVSSFQVGVLHHQPLRHARAAIKAKRQGQGKFQ